jgi:hypothetical protein
MKITQPAPGSRTRTDSLAERYVAAATRRLPEDQRGDVAAELRGSIADRIESLSDTRPDLTPAEAEYAALVELGDPALLAAGYADRPLQLIGPALYATYVWVLKAVLVIAVPTVTVVVAAIDVLAGDSAGAVIGHAVWMTFTLTIQVAFWVTLAFAIVERTMSPPDLGEEFAWSPDKLPPVVDRGSLGDLVASVLFIVLSAVGIVWQQVSAPISVDGGEDVPVLDPDLWSFWLPLILVLLAAELAFEIAKYLSGGWTTRFAAANTVLVLAIGVPLVYLAATDRLLNPAVVEGLGDSGWFDAEIVNTAVVVGVVLSGLWEIADGWRKARAS